MFREHHASRSVQKKEKKTGIILAIILPRLLVLLLEGIHALKIAFVYMKIVFYSIWYMAVIVNSYIKYRKST